MAAGRDDTEPDFAKSTGAFPMEREPDPVYLDHSGVDYAKSTGAFPMYDDRNATTRVVEHVGQEIGKDFQASFLTPGPISAGVVGASVQAQRKALGLSDDVSGESDRGAVARPSTVTIHTADGPVDEVSTAQTDIVNGTPVAKTAKSDSKASAKVQADSK